GRLPQNGPDGFIDRPTVAHGYAGRTLWRHHIPGSGYGLGGGGINDHRRSEFVSTGAHADVMCWCWGQCAAPGSLGVRVTRVRGAEAWQRPGGAEFCWRPWQTGRASRVCAQLGLVWLALEFVCSRGGVSGLFCGLLVCLVA